MLVLTSPRNWAIEVTALLMDVSCSSELNVASCAMNSVFDCGLVGSWFCSCVTSSFRKASLPSELARVEESAAAVGAVGAGRCPAWHQYSRSAPCAVFRLAN